MNFTLPKTITELLSLLRTGGFEAYVVGGAVRDFLMGKKPTDYDITTNALPEDVHGIFSAYTTISTGERFGTVTVVANGRNVEITTYRTDLGYSDNRRPDAVAFGNSLEADCARRDFTVNALCYDGTGEITDFFGGISDLGHKLIRTVGAPEERFAEDALRILRALRFASVLNFSIEEKTAAAIHKLCGNLAAISPERKYAELKNLLLGTNVGYIIRNFSDVLASVMPTLAPLATDEKQRELAAKAVRKGGIFPYHFALLCSFAMESIEQSAAIYHDFVSSLSPDNSAKRRFKALLESVFDDVPGDRASVKRLMAKKKPSEAMAAMTLQYRRAFALGDENKANSARRVMDEINDILESGECYSVNMLAVNGDDLIAAGVQPGKAVGEMLELLLDAVIEGKAENQKEALLALAAAIGNAQTAP